MKVLLLGPPRHLFSVFLSSFGDEVMTTDRELTADDLDGVGIVVSYGYRHILKRDALDRIGGRGVNLHISLLPWNRGADPNLWSFLEDTPKGVTIHRLEEGIDTGEIIAQREVQMRGDDTLRTSYARLTDAVEDLFFDVWPTLRSGVWKTVPQGAGGTYHRMKDKIPYEHLLTEGWDTPVCELIGKGVKDEVIAWDVPA